jgi:hypothetical protein
MNYYIAIIFSLSLPHKPIDVKCLPHGIAMACGRQFFIEVKFFKNIFEFVSQSQIRRFG